MSSMEDAVGPADAAVTALLGALGTLMGARPRGEWVERQDLVLYSANLPLPRFNGVVVLGAEAHRDTAAAWLEELASRELPYAILARPMAALWVDRLAVDKGLTTVEHEPFMCHVRPGDVADSAPGSGPDGFTIDPLDPSDSEQVAAGAHLLAEGFEAPLGLLDPLVAPELLTLRGMTAYIGRVGGRPCATGFGAVGDGHVGVFNIATPQPHRRRGLGRAVTARVIADGVAAGAHTAYLQASPMGYGLYEQMGFQTVETWSCYYPP
jgi:GNAT superfamily N-acetyltransferase